MVTTAVSLKHEMRFTGFTVRYYLTAGIVSGDNGSIQQSHAYGILLEKTDCHSNIIDTAEAWLSEEDCFAMDILQTLHRLEVTPVSLFEVIDQAIELAAQK